MRATHLRQLHQDIVSRFAEVQKTSLEYSKVYHEDAFRHAIKRAYTRGWMDAATREIVFLSEMLYKVNKMIDDAEKDDAGEDDGK